MSDIFIRQWQAVTVVVVWDIRRQRQESVVGCGTAAGSFLSPSNLRQPQQSDHFHHPLTRKLVSCRNTQQSFATPQLSARSTLWDLKMNTVSTILTTEAQHDC
jgi:hypothetical protein